MLRELNNYSRVFWDKLIANLSTIEDNCIYIYTMLGSDRNEESCDIQITLRV